MDDGECRRGSCWGRIRRRAKVRRVDDGVKHAATFGQITRTTWTRPRMSRATERD